MVRFETDSAGHKYVEIDTEVGRERLRVTFIPVPDYDDLRPALRIQIREESGRLRRGPEVPVTVLTQLVEAWVGQMIRRPG